MSNVILWENIHHMIYTHNVCNTGENIDTDVISCDIYKSKKKIFDKKYTNPQNILYDMCVDTLFPTRAEFYCQLMALSITLSRVKRLFVH